MAEPKKLDFGLPTDIDPEVFDLQRKMVLAKAMQQGVMGAQGGTFRKSPIAVIADVLALRQGKEQEATALSQFKEYSARQRAAEDAEMAELTGAQGGGQSDPRAVITKLMASRNPRVAKMAAEFQKNNSGAWEKLVQFMPDRLDTQSAITSSGAGGFGGGLRPAPPLPDPALMRSGENQWLQWNNRKGEPQVSHFPKGTTVNNNMGGKLQFEWMKEQAKHYGPGGKGYEEGSKLQEQLSFNQDLLSTLQENPTMGAGASGIQIARKWAEALGGEPIPETVTTDQLKSMLGQNVIKSLGTLGNQVSDGDRKAMAEALGQLETNPLALRRLVILASKYQMRRLATLAEETRQLQRHEGWEGTPPLFPGYNFQASAPLMGEIFEKPLPELPRLQPQSRIKPRNP